MTTFVIGTMFVSLDRRSHIYETGLFYTPKALELIYGIIYTRGLVNSSGKPLVSDRLIERLMLAFAFGLLAH